LKKEGDSTTASRWKYTYTTQRVLGKGAFAVVYPGTRRRGLETEPIAVKVCDPGSNAAKQRPIQLEIDTLKELRNHPNIVTLYTAFVDEGKVHMCFEQCDEDLEDYVRARPAPMSEAEIRVAGRQIASAVEYLHTQDIMHRDLKPRNILLVVTDEPSVRPFGRIAKVSDFGMARRGTPDSMVAKSAPGQNADLGRGAVIRHMDQTWCGSPLYMSPEMLYRQQYDKMVDIYAIGVILYYMRSRCTPVRGKTLDELRLKLPKSKLIWPDKTSKDLQDVCTAAMNHDSEQRPRRLSIHPFFQHVDPLPLEGSITDDYVVVDNGNNLTNTTAVQHTLLMAAQTRAVTESECNALEWAKSGMAATRDGPPVPDSPSHPERVRRLVDPERYERCSITAAARGDAEVARVMSMMASAGRALCVAPVRENTGDDLPPVMESNYLGTQAESTAPIPIGGGRTKQKDGVAAARFCYNCGASFGNSAVAHCRCGYLRHQHMSI
jgi:serine/threonine protein kinase